MNTTFDLLRFSETFKSEEELTNAVAALLNKMPHTQTVQVTHGPQEYGKDIVFYSPDAFEEWALHACVVKNTKITGSAEDSKGARTVFHQVEEALDTPFINASGEEERVVRVYVISPFDCPQPTMRSIQGKLKNRSGQVKFLCGSKLLEKFSQYWPEFIAFESPLLGTYIAYLHKGFDEADPIGFLMSQHNLLFGPGKTLTTVYVPQGFKSVLQETEFLVEIPSLSSRPSNLRLEDVNQVYESLQFAANFIANAQVWDKPDMEKAQTLSLGLLTIGNELKAAWNAKWEEDKKESEKLGRSAVPKSAASLLVSTLQTEQQEEFLRDAKTILDNFQMRCTEANRFARKATNLVTKLHSHDYLNYCRVHELVRTIPNAFRKLPNRREELYPQDLLNVTGKPLLVTAPAGYGKTSFCKWNTLNDVHKLQASNDSTVPVYVPLHQLANVKLTNPEDTFFRNTEVRHLVENANKREQRIRIYLDGLDEVTTAEQQRQLMDLAHELVAKHTNLQVVVTGRDYVSGTWLRWLSRVRLAELNDEQIERFIKNWLGEDEGDLQSFQQQLSKSGSLAHLMRIPLLATLVIAVFRKLKSLPENRVRLYEIFVDLMCGGWDFAKHVMRRDSRFGSNAKVKVLTRLAGILHINKMREGKESEFRTALANTAPMLIESWRSLLDEILEDGLIVRTGSTFAFSHLSFQEFLVAKDLTDPNASRQQLALKSFLSGDDWWREVMSFYLSMDKRPDEMEIWIRKTVEKLPSREHIYDLNSRQEFLMRSLQETNLGWAPKQTRLAARV